MVHLIFQWLRKARGHLRRTVEMNQIGAERVRSRQAKMEKLEGNNLGKEERFQEVQILKWIN